MIFIVVKFPIRPDRREDWLTNIKRYQDAVRAEQGNLFFDTYESIEEPNQFVVVEGFESPEAGAAHVKTDHFKDFLSWGPGVVAEVPRIIHTELEGGWGEMGELSR